MSGPAAKPVLLPGQISVDDRGHITFFNGFDFKGIKRFYMLENFSTQVIRAFHGHLKESKYVYVLSGSLLVAVVPLDHPRTPSRKNPVQRFILSRVKPEILHIPAGYANGFRALEDSSTILFFSTSTLQESQADDYRFPYDYWGKSIWSVTNR